MKVNNQETKVSQKPLKRSLPTLPPKSVLLSEERRPEMRLLKSRLRENLRELMLPSKRRKLKTMLNQSKRPRKRKSQLINNHLLRKPSLPKSNQSMMSQLRTNQLSELITNL